MPLTETEISNGVMTITLNDTARRNALSRELLGQLVTSIDHADRDPDVRVVVVTNHGPVFCAGANLAEQASRVETNGDQPPLALSELFLRVRNSPKPFVGRINGHCVAGGVGLAAVMDISVAVDSAMFGFSEVRVGVAPAIISVICLAKMRRADAQAAFLRGNRFSGVEAAQMGLINYAVASNEVDSLVATIVNDLLAGEPHALAATKLVTTVVPSLSDDEAFAWTTKLSHDLFLSDEAREGMAAFLEKRPASWVPPSAQQRAR